jgi:hypothetical protein
MVGAIRIRRSKVTLRNFVNGEHVDAKDGRSCLRRRRDGHRGAVRPGSVITVQRFTDEGQALRWANGVDYGQADEGHGRALRIADLTRGLGGYRRES